VLATGFLQRNSTISITIEVYTRCGTDQGRGRDIAAAVGWKWKLNAGRHSLKDLINRIEKDPCFEGNPVIPRVMASHKTDYNRSYGEHLTPHKLRREDTSRICMSRIPSFTEFDSDQNSHDNAGDEEKP
jgi:hypothetical protein